MTQRIARALLALSLALWTALSAGCAPLAAEALGLTLREPAASEGAAAASRPANAAQATQAPTMPPSRPARRLPRASTCTAAWRPASPWWRPPPAAGAAS